MEKLINRVIAESRYLCYPDSFPKVNIVESIKPETIELIKTCIVDIEIASFKGLAYAALGFVGAQLKQDQSGYIIDQLKNEKPEVVAHALNNMTGCKVPIHNRMNELISFMNSKRKDIKHAAFVASSLSETDWNELEIELVNRFVSTKSWEDQLWIASAFSKKGTSNCLPALNFAFENVTDSDVLVYCLKTLINIEDANQTNALIDIVKTKRDAYVKQLAITVLIKKPTIDALETILENAKKILSKKAKSKDIDYQGGYSELQACFMFLMIYKNENSEIIEFFQWVKDKRMDYMDNPTLKWAKKNL